MTTIPPDTAGREEEIRRSTSPRGRAEVVIGAAVAGLSLAALLVTRVLPAVNVLGFAVLAYLFFLVFYGVVVLVAEQDGRTVFDRLASVVVHSVAVLALLALAFVISFTFWRGREALGHLNFFTSDMQLAGPLDPLSVGGILHAAVGTLIELTIALLITVPLGLTGAVYLNEARGPLARFVRTVVEAMTALPAILGGLFILALFILTFGLAKSGLAAGLAMSVMMLPIIIRAADVVIRLVPGSLREASFALGAPRWRTAWHVVLPSARSGLTTAVLLGSARGLGETTPVLITAGFGSGVNVDITKNPMVSLPLVTFIFSRSPEPAMIARAFGAGTALLAMVLVLFALTRVIGGRPLGELSARAQVKRTRKSQRDRVRFAERDRFRRLVESSHGA